MTRPFALSVFLLPLCLPLSACKDQLTDKRANDKGDDDDNGDDDDDDDDDDDTGPAITFLAHIIDDISAPRFAAVADMDDDGTMEIIVSSLGIIEEANVPAGVISLYQLDGGLGEWLRTDIVNPSAGVRSPGVPLPTDVDSDGDLDLLIPAGNPLCNLPESSPCGGIYWLENNGGGSYVLREVAIGAAAFFTSAKIADLDNDGRKDIIAFGELIATTEQGALLLKFAGTGSGTFQAVPEAVQVGGGPLLELDDIDNDGDLDVMAGEVYTADSFAWYENVPTGYWPRNIIADNLGKGYKIQRIDDLYGDGESRIVATNHTNTLSPTDPDSASSQVVAFSIPSNPSKQWTSRDILSEGIVATPDTPFVPFDAPGEFAAGDIDEDGDLDLVVAGSGDPRVFLLDQAGEGDFITRTLAEAVGRSGGANMADLDGDGDLEIVVVSERDSAVYVIERE